MNSATRTTENAGASALAHWTTQKFLEAIIPGGAHIVTAILRPDGTMGHSFSSTHAQAAAIIAAAAAQGLTTYHACAAYGPSAGGRKGENVVAVGALWLDLDVGPGKPYAKKSEAAAALLKLVKKLCMPQPMVVNSGNGLHAYWRLASPVTPAEWLPVARSLKAAAVAFGLGADPTRTADVASILRPVGSFNTKDPANPRPVLMVLPGDPPEELTHYHTILGVEADVLADRPAHIPPGVADNSAFSAGDLGRQDQAQVDDVLAICGQLRAMRDAPESQGYAAWYGTLGILAYCEGGDDLAHEWGSGHPKYRRAQTQKFLDKWRTLSGGATCARLKADNPAGCVRCQFTGKSPLGAPRHHSIAKAAAIKSPSLRDASSDSLAPLSRAKSIMSEEEALLFMNARYGWCDAWGNGDGTYMQVGLDGLPRPISKEILLSAVQHLNVSGGAGVAKLTPIGPWWLRHPQRMVADRAIYDPEQKYTRRGETTLPLWRGFAVEEKPGSWSKMRRHLFEVWCAKNPPVFRYVLQWMAFAVQHPGTNPGTVLIVRSTREGTGKTMGASWLMRMFGPHAYQANTAEQVTGRFNDHLERCSLLIVNEPPFAGSKETQNKLKSLITESRISIERKFGGSYMSDNNLHIIMTTNEAWAVNAGADARRYVLLEANDARIGDEAYFKALMHEADTGGVEAMFSFLRHLNIQKFNPRVIPVTHGLREQQMKSLDILCQWGFALCDDPALAHLISSPFGDWVRSSELMEAIQNFAKVAGKRPPDANSFWAFLGSIGAVMHRRNVGRGWSFPDEGAVKLAVERVAGLR